jgi:hypothetical protein
MARNKIPAPVARPARSQLCAPDRHRGMSESVEEPDKRIEPCQRTQPSRIARGQRSQRKTKRHSGDQCHQLFAKAERRHGETTQGAPALRSQLGCRYRGIPSWLPRGHAARTRLLVLTKVVQRRTTSGRGLHHGATSADHYAPDVHPWPRHPEPRVWRRRICIALPPPPRATDSRSFSPRKTRASG